MYQLRGAGKCHGVAAQSHVCVMSEYGEAFCFICSSSVYTGGGKKVICNAGLN